MAQASFVGPLISLGAVAGGQAGQGPPLEYSDEIGPSLFWNGHGLVAPGGPGSKDQKGSGAFRALFMNDSFCATNAILATGGAVLTVAGNATSGTPLPLITAFAAGTAPGAPVLTPSGPQTGVAIDMGFGTGAATATSPTITSIADPWRYFPGMFVSLGGCGAAAAVLFAKVIAVGTTSITLDRPVVTSQATTPIGHVAGNPNSYGFQPQYYSNSFGAGSGRFVNPDCGAARGVGVTGVASGTGGNVLIQGLDVWLQPQSEIIAATAGATTVYGNKTYKVLLSATPQFTDAHNYTVVTSDLVGLPIALVNDGFLPQVLSNGAAYTTSVNQFADFTNPATTATKDPRGAVQLSAKGPNGGASGTGPNGSLRFTIIQSLNAAQVLVASPTNYAALYGVVPA
jgi:hypothetical protein